MKSESSESKRFLYLNLEIDLSIDLQNIPKIIMVCFSHTLLISPVFTSIYFSTKR